MQREFAFSKICTAINVVGQLWKKKSVAINIYYTIVAAMVVALLVR
jgi:hypothetical protein